MPSYSNPLNSAADDENNEVERRVGNTSHIDGRDDREVYHTDLLGRLMDGQVGDNDRVRVEAQFTDIRSTTNERTPLLHNVSPSTYDGEFRSADCVSSVVQLYSGDLIHRSFLGQFQEVKLVRKEVVAANDQFSSCEHPISTEEKTPKHRMLVLPVDCERLTDLSTIKETSDLECSICMSDFFICSTRADDDDERIDCSVNTAEDIPTLMATSSTQEESREIVQIKTCGHLFHKRCIIDWASGGKYHPMEADKSQFLASISDPATTLTRHDMGPRSVALLNSLFSRSVWMNDGKTCPLCRSNLQPNVSDSLKRLLLLGRAQLIPRATRSDQQQTNQLQNDVPDTGAWSTEARVLLFVMLVVIALTVILPIVVVEVYIR